MRKYNYSDHFDLLTIRHEYLKNAQNVEEAYIKKFEKVVYYTSKIMYNKLHQSFDKVGFDYNDIVSLSFMYLVGYLANYGFQYHQSSLDRFVNKFTKTHDRHPNEAEIAKAERNEAINFMRQKLQHCADTCRRKARNITVGCDVVKHFAKTEATKEAHEDVILDDYKSHGYRKVTAKELKAAQQRSKEKNQKIMTDENGFEIFTIQKFNNGLHVEDYLQMVVDHDTIFNGTPESYLIKLEEEVQDGLNLEKFNSLRQSDKISVLKKFINSNKGNVTLKEEMTSARKLLKKHSFWYGN